MPARDGESFNRASLPSYVVTADARRRELLDEVRRLRRAAQAQPDSQREPWLSTRARGLGVALRAIVPTLRIPTCGRGRTSRSPG
jgi:hypothetical protein